MSTFGVIRLPRQILFGRGQSGAISGVAANSVRARLSAPTRAFASTEACAAIMSDLESVGISTAIYDQVEPDLPKGLGWALR